MVYVVDDPRENKLNDATNFIVLTLNTKNNNCGMLSSWPDQWASDVHLLKPNIDQFETKKEFRWLRYLDYSNNKQY